jgi:cysteinyl-tRNA synthetase
MSMKYLGTTFDIHGGGKDLIFPHHENEIAQSEAATGKPFVNYWLHNGFVNINSEKMSKSLGNFFTIKEVLDKYDHEVLRFFLLSAHYRSPIDFSDQNLSEAETGLERIYKALATVEETLAKGQAPYTAPDPSALNEAQRELYDKAASLAARFGEAMDDDFNTALAMAHVFDLVRCVNRVLSEITAATATICGLCAMVKAEVAAIAGVLGIFSSTPTELLERLKSRKSENLEISVEEIEELIAERAAARKAKDFKRSDEIRDLLLSKNIALLDSPQGTTWSVK